MDRVDFDSDSGYDVSERRLGQTGCRAGDEGGGGERKCKSPLRVTMVTS